VRLYLNKLGNVYRSQLLYLCRLSPTAHSIIQLTNNMKKYKKVTASNYRAFSHQEKSNWCWAATSSNVAREKSTIVSQCFIAKQCLGNCPKNCVGGTCNQPHYLGQALASINLFAGWALGKPSRQRVIKELNANRPIGVRIAWQGSTNGHFILIFGYAIFNATRPDLHYFIFDPLKTQGVQLLRASAIESVNGYQLSGTWSETIFTS